MAMIILLACYVALTLAGLVLMKLGGSNSSFGSENGILQFGVHWITLIGFVCYLCSFLLFTRIVVMFDLSYIMPLVTGIIQVLILIAAYVIFKEKITLNGIIGAAVVILGIVIMNWKSR